MAAKRGRRRPAVLVIIGILILVGGLAVLAGLAIVDYGTALAVILGVVGAVVLVWLLRRLWRSPRRGLWLAAILVLLVVGVGGVALLNSLLVSPDFTGAGEDAAPEEPVGGAAPPEVPQRELDITEYRATIRRDEAQGDGEIVLTEEVIYQVHENGTLIYADQLLALPPRPLASEPRGFLLREVSFEPLEVGPYERVSLVLPDGTEMRAALCTFRSCPPARVELQDFPENAFFGARGVTMVESMPYLRTETITWTPADLSDGITFAYVPAPYHYLRPVLVPFIGASTLDDWMVSVIALLGTLVAAPLVVPLLEYAAERAVGNMWRRLFKKRRSTATSGSGQ